jgi:DNA-binding IclR family transcriptional regulator
VKGEDRRGIKAIEVAGQILDHLALAQTPVALRELAAAGRMSPGKIHRYLVSFLVTGLARQDPDTRRYALGPLAMRLGLAVINSLSVAAGRHRAPARIARIASTKPWSSRFGARKDRRSFMSRKVVSRSS